MAEGKGTPQEAVPEYVTSRLRVLVIWTCSILIDAAFLAAWAVVASEFKRMSKLNAATRKKLLELLDKLEGVPPEQATSRLAEIRELLKSVDRVGQHC